MKKIIFTALSLIFLVFVSCAQQTPAKTNSKEKEVKSKEKEAPIMEMDNPSSITEVPEPPVQTTTVYNPFSFVVNVRIQYKDSTTYSDIQLKAKEHTELLNLTCYLTTDPTKTACIYTLYKDRLYKVRYSDTKKCYEIYHP